MTTTRPAIEILGPWLHNKGDDLMLRSIVQRLRNDFALAVSSPLGMDEIPRNLPLHRVVWPPGLRDLRRMLASQPLLGGFWLLRRSAGLLLAPRAIIRSRGIVDGRDLVALLDCSGFAYGDHWPVHRLESRTEYYDLLKSRGVKLVMLPQALGPFEKPPVREAARALFSRFDLIFARDSFSRQHLCSLGLENQEIGICPDITHLLDPVVPSDAEVWSRRVCIVPNARMLDRTPAEVGTRYAAFLAQGIRCARDCGLEACLVLHETNDADLAREVRDLSGVSPRMFDEDAQVSKGFLGACYAVIGSRYHALISALSQATPCLGTSWTHKYDAMFEEYECGECLVSPLDEPDALDMKLRSFLAPARRQELHQHLAEAAARQKRKVESMWQQVERLLRGGR